MGRTRQLKFDFFLDEDLSQLPHVERIGFLGLIAIADREGRLEDRPMKIRAEVFPYEPEIDMEPILGRLAKEKTYGAGSLITRYAVGDRRYIQVNNFKKHQNPHPNEAKSTIPPPGSPPEDSRPVLRGESLVQSLWAKALNADREVRCESGTTDLVTPTHAFEVKRAYNWRTAMRQIVLAASDLGLSPAVILFSDRDIAKKNKDPIEETLGKRNISIIWGIPSDYSSEQLNEIKSNFSQIKAKRGNADPQAFGYSGPSGSSAPKEACPQTPLRAPAAPVYWEPKPTWRKGHPSLEAAVLHVNPEHLSVLQKDFRRVEGEGGGGVKAEISKLKRHALENPSWAKKIRDWTKTLTNWLKRADERFDDARFHSERSRDGPKPPRPKGFATLEKFAATKGELDGDG